MEFIKGTLIPYMVLCTSPGPKILCPCKPRSAPSLGLVSKLKLVVELRLTVLAVLVIAILPLVLVSVLNSKLVKFLSAKRLVPLPRFVAPVMLA